MSVEVAMGKESSNFFTEIGVLHPSDHELLNRDGKWPQTPGKVLK
jgi:hypothetical protein